ncbi:NAD(P)-dependent oxidoreductase [Parashewanella tropica]|uniref:NAD(P)-dependent oxidoreductase n=1 Tax=Parashewanella tropica TaxID=2547970 RepID=UPI00105A48F7|nr:NAD(P)-dependent oxidoreductase [Parashewanella tropica]
MASDRKVDIQSHRLSDDEYQQNFSDVKPALTAYQAHIESNRCLYCEDAPCISACPTRINIPSFIQKIADNNTTGAAKTILEANILGGSCARVCPTEILCEGVCVRNKEPEYAPIKIGRLQRYALDNFNPDVHPFQRLPSSGKKVAIVGAGPAGMACAHHLARQGHSVVMFDKKPKAGGLNEYGIAHYKMQDDFAQKELEFILELGGIELKPDVALGQSLHLDTLRQEYDAVFLALGLNKCKKLGLEQEVQHGLENSLEYITDIRQAQDLAHIPVGNKVVVIGAGNTAVDIACQTKRLGAGQVTLVYRRGVANMSATDKELEFARQNDVAIITWARPVALVTNKKHQLTAIQFERTQLDDAGQLRSTQEHFELAADSVFKAIGQEFDSQCFSGSEAPDFSNNRIKVDTDYKTSLSNVWAGGDCIHHDGEDLTVQSVEHGKQAANSIHHYLEQ